MKPFSELNINDTIFYIDHRYELRELKLQSKKPYTNVSFIFKASDSEEYFEFFIPKYIYITESYYHTHSSEDYREFHIATNKKLLIDKVSLGLQYIINNLQSLNDEDTSEDN